jgi:uroporphyrin-III C-methyltransferase/precorrin-2 dehydrogenase/sirohydrochlorin ferrochelatase
VLVIGGGEIAARKIMFLPGSEPTGGRWRQHYLKVADLVERQEIQWRAHELKQRWWTMSFW